MYLSSNGRKYTRKIVVLHLSVFHPRREPAKLAIVSIVRHPHLRADEQNFRVVNDDSAIINDIFVHHWPENGFVNLCKCESWTSLTCRCHIRYLSLHQTVGFLRGLPKHGDRYPLYRDQLHTPSISKKIGPSRKWSMQP